MSSDPWDGERWKERNDNQWTAGCRWLQTWWRHHDLALPPGPISSSRPERLVASMLPLDAPTGSNFLSPAAAQAVRVRVAEGNHSGIIDQDRLNRNLLSSQPACFNLFGPFVSAPDELIGWVHSIDRDAVRVTGVRFEWAPPRADHFDGGSAFDAFLTYEGPGDGQRFLGVSAPVVWQEFNRSSFSTYPAGAITHHQHRTCRAGWPRRRVSPV